jgi:hypothetical protein
MANDLGELLVKLSAEIKGLEAGLSKAKSDLQGFQGYVRSFSDEVKRLLAFAGIVLGLYELASTLKEFASSAALTGARTETLAVAMETIGKNAGISRASLNYYVEQLKGVGISTQEAMQSVSLFLTQGLPLEKLRDLADVARNQAVLAGKNTSETLQQIIHGITTGQLEMLRTVYLNIGNLEGVVKRAMGETGKSLQEIDPVTRAMAVLNEVLRVGQRSAGAYEASLGTVGKQMGSLARYAQEAKNALWEFFKPIMEGLVGAQTKGWQSLETWAKNNTAALRDAGRTVGEWIKWALQGMQTAAEWAARNWVLIKTLAEFFIITKITGWVFALARSLYDAAKAVYAFTTAAKAAQLAAGGWLGIVIKLVAGLAALGAYKTMKEGMKAPESTAEAMLLGEAAVLVPPEKKEVSKPAEQEKPAAASPEQAMAESEAAFKKTLEESKKLMEGIGKAGGGKGAAKELHEDLLNYLTQYLETKRQLEIQEAEESYATFKAVQDKKKAELEQALAEGMIGGQEYYRTLKDMAQSEADQALRLIDLKMAKERDAYAWAQKELTNRAAAGEISPEALDLAQQKLQAEHLLRLRQLEGQGLREKIKLEKESLDLLKQEYENRKRIEETLAASLEESALGPVAEKEAEINRLLRERLKLREELVRLGATEGELGRFDRATGELELNRRSGDQIKGYADTLANGFNDIIDAFMSGGQNLMSSLNRMFKELFTKSLKPGLDALQQWLLEAFKGMFGSLGSTLANVVMGVIGLIGMLLTGGGGSSSWSPSGVQSSVTGHEAVRGIIAGETSIPIAQIGESLQDALVPTNSILNQIEANTRAGKGGSGGGRLDITVTLKGIEEQINAAIERYFREYLVMGAGG